MSMNSTATRASSNRPLRFIIIGAGPAGHPRCDPIDCRRASRTSSFTRRRIVSAARGATTVPRRRVRRAFASVLLFVRAQPGVEPPLRAWRRDPRVPRRRRAPLRRGAAHSLRGGSDAAANSSTAAGESKRKRRLGHGGRRHRRHRRDTPSAACQDSRVWIVRGSAFHSARWDHSYRSKTAVSA